MTPVMKSKQVPRGTPLYGPYGEVPPKRDAQGSGKGGFPLSRNFYVLTQVNFTRDNKIETIGPFIRGKIRRVLNKSRTFRVNGTFRLK